MVAAISRSPQDRSTPSLANRIATEADYDGHDDLRQVAGMRLGAPLCAVVYGLALIVAAPLAWQAGNEKVALFIGAVAIFGIALEATRNGREARR